MANRTFSANHSRYDIRRTSVILLSVLAVAAPCAARQAQPGTTRRLPPAARLKVLQLPAPATSSAVSVEQALVGLRSLPAPGNQRLDLPKISQLAWAIQGAMVAGGANSVGTMPMAAEAATMKVHFVLPDGVYLYHPLDHSLQQTADEDVREALAAALFNQTGAPIGGCQIILAASLQDFTKRYGARARTVMLLQAGRMAQSMQLEAVAQGLTFASIDGVDAAAVRRVTRSLRAQEPFYVAFVGYPAGQGPAAIDQGQTAQAAALFIVPPHQFQDEEFLVTKRALEQAGVQVTVASTRMGLLTGMLGGTVRADLLLNQAKLDTFHAVVFIGGNGALDYLNNPVVLNVVRQAATQRRVLAAIGTAPSILAGAGALRGARATAFPSEQARLLQGGALYTGNPVEKDGITVTALGPAAAALFAQAIVNALNEAQPITTTATPTK